MMRVAQEKSLERREPANLLVLPELRRLLERIERIDSYEKLQSVTQQLRDKLESQAEKRRIEHEEAIAELEAGRTILRAHLAADTGLDLPGTTNAGAESRGERRP